MPETPQPNPQEPTPPTATPSGVDRKALEELAAAMQDLRTSVDTNTTQSWNKPVTTPIPVTPSAEILPESVDFTDPVAVRKYINDEMTRVKTEANKAYVVDQARRMYDQLIDQEFPDMQQTNSDIYKETIKEVRKRMGVEGVSSIEEMRQKTPSIFYDAACTASVRLNRVKQAGTPESRRLSGITGGYVEGGTNIPPPPALKPQISNEQRFFADKLGLDPKVLETIQPYAKGSDGVYRLVQK